MRGADACEARALPAELQARDTTIIRLVLV